MKTRKYVPSLLYIIAVSLLAVYLIPLWWNLSTSLRTDANLFDPNQWVPRPITFSHYRGLLAVLPKFWRYTLNTLNIAVMATVGVLASCSMSGYALARLNFPGKDALFMVILATSMIPSQVTLIPIYVMFRKLGWINTPLPLIVPSFFGNAFATFFFRQFMLSIPVELEEAVFIDGGNRFKVFVNVVLPISKPALITIGLINFINNWNGYFNPKIYLLTAEQWVLTQALQSLVGLYTSQWGEIMAGVIMMSLPVVMLYIFLQRFIVKGIVMGAIKG
ncbi:MAG: carbohydrate ABC transporter permease [Limnochordia bacterium]|jgi:multiple sugar transport system permease protein